MKLIQDLGMFGNKPNRIRYGIYECPVCLKHFKANTYQVKQGRSAKCKGCASRQTQTKHGLCSHRLYRIWSGMIKRIEDKDYLHRTHMKGVKAYLGDIKAELEALQAKHKELEQFSWSGFVNYPKGHNFAKGYMQARRDIREILGCTDRTKELNK